VTQERDGKEHPNSNQPSELTSEGCLILALSLVVMAGFAMPILKLTGPNGLNLSPGVPLFAILWSGAFSCALGAGVLRVLRAPMWKDRKDRSEDDLD
jgi:hypothetical protein